MTFNFYIFEIQMKSINYLIFLFAGANGLLFLINIYSYLHIILLIQCACIQKKTRFITIFGVFVIDFNPSNWGFRYILYLVLILWATRIAATSTYVFMLCVKCKRDTAVINKLSAEAKTFIHNECLLKAVSFYQVIVNQETTAYNVYLDLCDFLCKLHIMWIGLQLILLSLCACAMAGLYIRELNNKKLFVIKFG